MRSAFLSPQNVWLISLGIVGFSVCLCEKLLGASMFIAAAVRVGPVLVFHPVLTNTVIFLRRLCSPSSLPETCLLGGLSSLRYFPFFPALSKLSSDSQIQVLSRVDNYFVFSYFRSYSFTAAICCLLLVGIYLPSGWTVIFNRAPFRNTEELTGGTGPFANL